MTCANWFRNGSLFAGCIHMNYTTVDFHCKKHWDWVNSFMCPMFVSSIAVSEGDKHYRAEWDIKIMIYVMCGSLHQKSAFCEITNWINVCDAMSHQLIYQVGELRQLTTPFVFRHSQR